MTEQSTKTKPKLREKILIDNDGQQGKQTIVTGRVLWALKELMSGPCTPIIHPAPRWSDYVFRLRNEGVVIETEHEPHGGDYPGTHAKYHLRSKITFVNDAGEAA